MAKRTKLTTVENKNSDVLNSTSLDVSGTTSSTLSTITNNNTNIKNECNLDKPSIPVELEKFTILKDNIIKGDDYIKFTELASKYILFNKIDLNMLCKSDLICLIGSVINELYITKNTLTNMQHEQALKKQTSFDKPISYSDLLGNLSEYKSWN